MEQQTRYEQSEAWAAAEFGHAVMGDRRRTERLIRLAAALLEHPDTSVPEACGSWAATKAAYRFFSNGAVDPEDICVAHRQATLRRVETYPMILAVQDTAIYNFTTNRKIRGAGPVGKPGDPTSGFFAHSCLAVSPEGVPLGLLGQHFWVRPPYGGNPRTYDQIRKLPVEEKESVRWLRMLESSTQGVPSATRVVTVADREADMFEFFLAGIRLQQDLLVRAARNRRLNDPDTYLWDAAEQAELVGTLTVQVPRADEQPERVAELELRVAPVMLRVPQTMGRIVARSLPPIALHAVLVRETHPPGGQEPIEWLLLTTLHVSSAAMALDCVRWYTYRWRIERYHYVLKSGCRIEQLQLEDVERLYRALAVYSVIAWRLLHLTYLARTEPHSPCSMALSTPEWQALYCITNRTKRPPQTPPDLATAVLWIARLGGFLARKHDKLPGVKVLWQGFRRLEDLAAMWELLNRTN